jgi:hypothetical protein
LPHRACGSVPAPLLLPVYRGDAVPVLKEGELLGARPKDGSLLYLLSGWQQSGFRQAVPA